MTFVVKVAKVIGFFRLVEMHLEQKTCLIWFLCYYDIGGDSDEVVKS